MMVIYTKAFILSYQHDIFDQVVHKNRYDIFSRFYI